MGYRQPVPALAGIGGCRVFSSPGGSVLGIAIVIARIAGQWVMAQTILVEGAFVPAGRCRDSDLLSRWAYCGGDKLCPGDLRFVNFANGFVKEMKIDGYED